MVTASQDTLVVCCVSIAYSGLTLSFSTTTNGSPASGCDSASANVTRRFSLPLSHVPPLKRFQSILRQVDGFTHRRRMQPGTIPSRGAPILWCRSIPPADTKARVPSLRTSRTSWVCELTHSLPRSGSVFAAGSTGDRRDEADALLRTYCDAALRTFVYGHSLRIAAVTTLNRAQVPFDTARRFGRWASANVYGGYISLLVLTFWPQQG